MKWPRTTETIEEAAEWFCDNPNCQDILDELRLIDTEAEERGRRWAIDLLNAWAEESASEECRGYIRCAQELREAHERLRAEESS